MTLKLSAVKYQNARDVAYRDASVFAENAEVQDDHIDVQEPKKAKMWTQTWPLPKLR